MTCSSDQFSGAAVDSLQLNSKSRPRNVPIYRLTAIDTKVTRRCPAFVLIRANGDRSPMLKRGLRILFRNPSELLACCEL